MSQIEEFAEQLKDIVTGGQFSEEATLTLDDGSSYSVSGIFFSGSYEEDRMAAYSTKNLVDRDFFQISVSELVDVDRPWETLRGVLVELREKTFRVSAISGKRDEILTLELQEMDDE